MARIFEPMWKNAWFYFISILFVTIIAMYRNIKY